MTPEIDGHDRATSSSEPGAPAAANGIDAVDVSAVGKDRRVGSSKRAVDLLVHLFRPIKEDALPGPDNVRIIGPGRGQPLAILDGPHLAERLEPGQGLALRLTVNDPGDGLPYVLSLVEAGGAAAYRGFDPGYASIDFRFRGDCATEADCGVGQACLPAPRGEGAVLEVDYLAKDYASFRRLMFDRLAETVPDWSDRSVPDLGVTLVEVLAYAADHLSYYQDAVATEAYLDTARRRVSVRRHARLVDYPMHDGCNARTWICIEVAMPGTTSDATPGDAPNGDPCPVKEASGLDTPLELDPEEFYVFTDRSVGPLEPPPPPIRNVEQLLDPAESDRIVFAPVVSRPSGWQALRAGPWLLPSRRGPRKRVRLYARHNTIGFWAPAGKDLCLSRGATAATLVGPLPNLRAGDVLIFEEVLGPQTEMAEDADPAHRHAVRLRRVGGANEPRVEIEWFEDDALPFPLCLRGATGKTASVARGNVLLVDQGIWRPGEELRPLPPLPPGLKPRSDGLRGAWRYQPLAYGPLTQAAPFPDPAVVASVQAGYLAGAIDWYAAEGIATPSLGWLLEVVRHGMALVGGPAVAMLRGLTAALPMAGPLEPHPWEADEGEGAGEEEDEAGEQLNPLAYGPASSVLGTNAAAALPALIVRSAWGHRRWRPRRDLLGQVGEGRAVVVEVDDEGRAHLRFDDETPGQAPLPGEPLLACYRTGEGTAGNVGPETLVRVVATSGPIERIAKVRNPIAAVGGTDPEAAETAKRLAPGAFRADTPRAITADDYAARAGRDPRVQKAAATLTWTGTGFEARVVLDLKAETIARYGAHVDRVYREIEADLRTIRRVGHDVRVLPARMVPLLLQLRVVLRPEVLRVPVVAVLRTVLGAGLRPDGRKAFFHPDRLTFGSAIAVGAVVGEAQKVSGVVSAVVEKFRPLDDDGGADDLPGDWVLAVGPLEIPQLDGDPNAPERGELILCLEGGR